VAGAGERGLQLRVAGQQQGMKLLAERGACDAAAGPLGQLPADLAFQGGNQPAAAATR
jgi:hypothetical protein